MRTFEITASSHSLAVKAGQSAQVSLTVTSKAASALTARTAVRVSEGMEKTWVAVEPERLAFAPGGTERVTLNVAVPAGAPAARHEAKLVVANDANPDDDWTESAPLALTVEQAREGGRFPWWIVAVAAAVLIVVIGGYVTYRLMQRPGFREACEPGRCSRGLVCAESSGGADLCLGDTGWPCSGHGDCGPRLTCADEDGNRPKPATQEPAGEARRADVTSAVACRKPQPLWACESDSECAESQACVSVEGGKLCALADGESCRVDVQCVSTWCKDGQCTPYTGACSAAADCRSAERCHRGRCVFPEGHACTDDGRCETGNCEGGVCKPSGGDPPIDPCAKIRCPPSRPICVLGRCIAIRSFLDSERSRLFREGIGVEGVPEDRLRELRGGPGR